MSTTKFLYCLTLSVSLYAKMPLIFEANQGQTDTRARFLARATGYTVLLNSTGATFKLRDSAVSIQITGAKPAQLQPESPLDSYSNYYRGSDPSRWITKVPHYARIRASQILSGIDLIYHADSEGQLEYDLEIAPNNRTRTIPLTIDGARALHLTPNGDLEIETATGTLIQHKPLAWQGKHSVVTTYALGQPGHAEIRIGDYDQQQPLTIDPVISYVTYLGGTGQDYLTALAADSTGSIYLTGYTTSTDFPGATGTNQGNADVFVAKLNPSGTALIYATYVGGSLADSSSNLAVDGVGNAYLAGYTDSTNYPVTLGGACPSVGLTVTKLDPNGTLTASRCMPGDGIFGNSLGAAAIATAPNGSIYLLGSTVTQHLATPGAWSTVFSYSFVARLDSSLHITSATYLKFGGSALAVSPTGNIFVTGRGDPSVATPGAYVHVPGNTSYAAVAELNPELTTAAWVSVFGGSGNATSPYGIAVDSQENVYVAGSTEVKDFPVTHGAFQETARNSTMLFVTKLMAGGSALQYSTLLGGSTEDRFGGLAVDSSGNAYITGNTSSFDFPTTPGSFQYLSDVSGGILFNHGFFTELSSDGTKALYSTYFAGGGLIALDGKGGVYLPGSGTWPTTPGAFQSAPKAAQNPIITKVDMASGTSCSISVSPNPLHISGGPYSGTLSIQTPAGCPWALETNARNPVTVNPLSGYGPTTVNVAIAQNRSTDQQVLPTIIVHGSPATTGSNIVSITQDAGSCTSPTFIPSQVTLSPKGGLQYVSVNLPDYCLWNLSGLPDWLTNNTTPASPYGLNGTGTLILGAGANGATPRQATLTIATGTLTVTQPANVCFYQLASASTNVGAQAGSGSISFTASLPSCQWTATAPTGWIQLSSSTTGQGSSSVSFTFPPNPETAPRTGSIQIGDQTYQVIQAGGSKIQNLSYTGALFTAKSVFPGQLFTGDGGSVSRANVWFPKQLNFDTAGNLYIADSQNNRIRRVDPSGTITTVAGGGTSNPGDSGPATSATLHGPHGVVADRFGTLYIADTGALRIRKVTNGGIVTIAGDGTVGYNGDGKLSLLATLSPPENIALDTAGNIYFTDSTNQRVRKIAPNNLITTIAGNGANAISADGIPATSAALGTPSCLTLDAVGNVYFCDHDTSRVRKIALDGTLTTVAGSGIHGFAGDGGPANLAWLDPASVLIDPSGVIFVGGGDGKLRAVTPDGTINTVWQGPGEAIDGLAIDPSGTIYATQNDSIYKLTSGISTCTYSIETPPTHPGAYGYLSVKVTTSALCSWGVTLGVPWISTDSPSGTGTGSASLFLQPNPGSSPRSATITIGGQPVTITQLGSPVAFASQTFTFSFTSPTGIQNINGAQIVINPTLTAVNSCYVLFGRPNLISLADDSGTHFTSSTLGVPARLENSQCVVLLSQGSQKISGNTITLTLSIAFKSDSGGAKNVWSNLDIAATGYQGWIQSGTSSASGPTLALNAVSVSPDSGTGQAQAFTFSYLDPLGAPDISGSQIVINTSATGVKSCYVLFNSNNLISLADDTGNPTAPVVLGSQVALQNSQCIIYVGDSFQSQSGQTLNVTLYVAFKPAYAGTKYLYANLTNVGATTTEFPLLGSWTIPATAPPLTAPSLNPPSPTGPSQALTFTFSDPNGFADIASTQVNIGACQIQFNRASGQIALNGGASGTLGNPSAIQNAQCIVNLASSSQFGAGNYLKLTLFVTMKTVGNQAISSTATSVGATSSPSAPLGMWNVTSPSTLSAVSAAPATTSVPANSFQPFTFTMSNPNGASAIDGALLLFYPSLQGANACYILWGRGAGLSLASNDATTFTTGALGSSNLLQNTQCTVDPSKSFETETGNTVNLTVSVAFKAPFQAFNQVYSWLNAGDNQGVFSGWSLESRFTVK